MKETMLQYSNEKIILKTNISLALSIFLFVFLSFRCNAMQCTNCVQLFCIIYYFFVVASVTRDDPFFHLFLCIYQIYNIDRRSYIKNISHTQTRTLSIHNYACECLCIHFIDEERTADQHLSQHRP